MALRFHLNWKAAWWIRSLNLCVWRHCIRGILAISRSDGVSWSSCYCLSIQLGYLAASNIKTSFWFKCQWKPLFNEFCRERGKEWWEFYTAILKKERERERERESSRQKHTVCHTIVLGIIEQYFRIFQSKQTFATFARFWTLKCI